MKKRSRKKEYARVRADSGQHRRILLVGILFGVLAFVPVIFRLYQLMVVDYDYYSGLALRNQSRTTRVTADRGTIYDRNMQILACSQTVEDVYLDPHELKQSKADMKALSRELGQILNKDPAWILEQGKDTKKRYKKIADRIDEATASQIREYINTAGIAGIHLEDGFRCVTTTWCGYFRTTWHSGSLDMFF